MGMHFGVIAATIPWSSFSAQLSSVTGPFTDQGPITDVTDEVLQENGGDVAVAGEYRGASYLMDPIMVLSVGNSDLLVGLSSALSCTVASCAAETVSGTYSLLIAHEGKARRVYYNCISAVTAPFSVGTPLQAESSVPLEDIDGAGLFACLKEVGLDYPEWFARGSKRLLALGADPSESSQGGSLDAAFKEHWSRFERPQKGTPKTRVAMRRLPDGSTGFDIVPDEGGRASVLKRFMSWFRK